MKEKQLSGKLAVITGAAQGLGEALALRLFAEGCQVVVCDINQAGVDAVAQKCEGKAYGLDVTNFAMCEAVASEVAALGGADILISNAAILLSGDIFSLTASAFAKVVDVNLNGYFNLVKAFAPQMLQKGKGSIIQINSKSGKVGSAKNGAYAASKFGGVGLTQSLALEFAKSGVRVNCVCPGNLLDSPLWVNSLYKQYAKNQNTTEEAIREKYTNQVPMGRGCTYQDIENAVVFLASDGAAYMTGQSINITGGQVLS